LWIYINDIGLFLFQYCNFSSAEPSDVIIHQNNYTAELSCLHGRQLSSGGLGLNSQALTMPFVMCGAELRKGYSVSGIC
jgi:hypothetical protein